MNKEILFTEPELWGALDLIFNEGLAVLPYADDQDLAEESFNIFGQVPDIDFKPVEVSCEVFQFLQLFAQQCLDICSELLSDDEANQVRAFIEE